MRNEQADKIFRRYIAPAIELLCALGASAVAYLGMVGRAHAYVLGQGVSPASNLTTNLPQSLVTQYDKVNKTASLASNG